MTIGNAARCLWLVNLLLSPNSAEVLHGPAPCATTKLRQQCNSLGECHPDNEDCPPVTTEASCGEHPHSGRDGAVLTWGLSFRTASAQECCDKCKAHTRRCNSWTFCGLPVCWGLDTGHNHTFGECWLRRLSEDALSQNKSFRQRGKYTEQWLTQHRRSRPMCKTNAPWACSPTHVPYTSGALGGPVFNPAERWVTGGGWGKVFVSTEADFAQNGPPAANAKQKARRVARRKY